MGEKEVFDLVISNVRLRGRGEGFFHVGIRGDRIAAVSPGPLSGAQTIDGGGGLCTESFANPHMHLCKVYTLERLGDEALERYTGAGMDQAMAAIELAARVKEDYDESWIYDNARRAALEGLRHGVTRVLAFADTDTKAKLEGVRALLRLRDDLKGVMTLKVVAFPQDGLLRDEGAEQYIREALELGADVVGGIPWIEDTDEEAEDHVARMFSLAVEFDRDVAMLVDDAGDPTLKTTEMLAKAAVKHRWQNRVVACHARALGVYPKPYLYRLMRLLRRAGMGFVVNPHTGALQLPAREMMEAGVPVALGQDDIADAYYPYGQHNMLEVAFLASHIMHMVSKPDTETLLDMVTSVPARMMGFTDGGMEPGKRADLVVLDGADPREVILRHAPPRYVVSGGMLVAENRETTVFHGLE